tara:strand:- start:1527 stop:1790 length:264 start_codon:yes stop_codon:yes gene_type:complete
MRLDENHIRVTQDLTTRFESELKLWIAENLAAGTDPKEMSAAIFTAITLLLERARSTIYPNRSATEFDNNFQTGQILIRASLAKSEK